MKPSLAMLVWAPLSTLQPRGSPDGALFFISLSPISFPCQVAFLLASWVPGGTQPGPGYRHRLCRDLFPGTVEMFQILGKGQ